MFVDSSTSRPTDPTDGGRPVSVDDQPSGGATAENQSANEPVPLDHVRILAAHPVPDVYGSDLMLLRSLRAARDAGASVRIVTAEPGPLLEQVAAAGIPFDIMPFPVLRKALLRPLALLRLVATTPFQLRRLMGLIRQEKPTVVYVNTLTLPHWLLAAKLVKVPVVCHVRELESGSHRLVTKALTSPLLLAGTVVANSYATARFVSENWRALAGRTRVVYNGLPFPVDASPVPPATDGVRLVLVGRLSPRKGQDLAIEAVERLRGEGIDVSLSIVGSPFRGYEWYEAELREKVAAAGLDDHIAFHGYTNDVWSAYAESHVVLVPSRMEPFGSVAVEAMAIGRPVIASEVGGLPEIVHHGRTGLLIPESDLEALVQAIRTLALDPERMSSMGEHAAGDVRRRFAAERYARELSGVLEGAGRSAG